MADGNSTPEEKFCPGGCGRTLPVTAFRPRPERGPHATHTWCRDCAKRKSRERCAARKAAAELKPPDPSTPKVCKGPCGRTLTFADFYDNFKNKDGKFSLCKECFCAKEKEKFKNPETRESALAAAAKRQREWNAANPERAKANYTNWRKTNPEKVAETSKRAYKNRKEREPEVLREGNRRRSRKWRKAEKNRKVQLARAAASRAKKPIHYRAKSNAAGARRRVAEKRATPLWADKTLIDAMYREAQKRGAGYAVDHIVPLNSPLVCGLHVHNNLQILTATENAHKNNLWWPRMWGPFTRHSALTAKLTTIDPYA